MCDEYEYSKKVITLYKHLFFYIISKLIKIHRKRSENSQREMVLGIGKCYLKI